MTRCSEFVTSVCCASVLPHDGRAVWLASRTVPRHDGLTLVGDADRGDRLAADLLDHRIQGRDRGAPDFVDVVFDPAGLGIVLSEFTVRRDRGGVVGEDGSAAHACGSGVEGDHTFGHARRIVSAVGSSWPEGGYRHQRFDWSARPTAVWHSHHQQDHHRLMRMTLVASASL